MGVDTNEGIVCTNIYGVLHNGTCIEDDDY